MEEIKLSIQGVLGNMTEDEASTLAEHLREEVGVEGPEDLVLVEPGDLPMLKPIQIRKLIKVWKSKAG